jgi:outer membrane autotransporter protein
MRRSQLIHPVVSAGLLLATGQAHAANAEYQSFFFDACVAPTGALATRCAQTPGGAGDLSGDSESSLNPSQNLSHTLTSASLAQTRTKEARERGERLRDGESIDEQAGAQLVAGPFSLLFNVHATWFERKRTPTTASGRGFEGDSAALEIGMDYRLSDRAVVGAIAGIERVQYDFDAEQPGVSFTPAKHAGSVDSDDTYLTLFGSWTLGASGFVELSGGYERYDGAYRRNPVFQESTRTVPQVDVRVEGDALRTVWWASVNAGLDFNRDALSVGPYAGLTVARSDIESYTERDPRGTGLAMRFGAADSESLLGHAGVRASYAFGTSGGVIVPQARIEYQHEFEDDPTSVASRFVLDTSATRYELTGGSADRDFVVAGLSLSAILPNGWICFADYSLLLANDQFDRERASLGLRVEF